MPGELPPQRASFDQTAALRGGGTGGDREAKAFILASHSALSCAFFEYSPTRPKTLKDSSTLAPPFSLFEQIWTPTLISWLLPKSLPPSKEGQP